MIMEYKYMGSPTVAVRLAIAKELLIADNGAGLRQLQQNGYFDISILNQIKATINIKDTISALEKAHYIKKIKGNIYTTTKEFDDFTVSWGLGENKYIKKLNYTRETNDEVYFLLKKHGKDYIADVLTIAMNDMDFFKSIIESQGFDLTIRDKSGNTLMHLAAQYRNIPAMVLLRAKGVNMELKNKQGFTVLALLKKLQKVKKHSIFKNMVDYTTAIEYIENPEKYKLLK
jgi:hypothetical protein